MFDIGRNDQERLVEEQGWFLDHGTKDGSKHLEDLHPTTKRYPRTIEEAFPDSIERAEWFYPPERYWTFWDYALAGIGVFLWIQLAYYLASL